MRSKVKWAKRIELEIGKLPTFTDVVLYAVRGNDSVLEHIEPVPGDTVRDQNKRKRDLKDKFVAASKTFIIQLKSNMTEEVLRSLQRKPENDAIEADAIEAGARTRDFWALIKTTIVDAHKDGPKLTQAEHYFERLRGDRMAEHLLQARVQEDRVQVQDRLVQR